MHKRDQKLQKKLGLAKNNFYREISRMSEKFRKIVNAPHRAVKKLKENIMATEPQKTAGKIARGAGVATTGFIQGLLWFIEHFTLDNFVTRGGEKAFSKIKVGKNKDGKDKKFPKFIKKNPNFTSIVSWWMLLASLVGVGVANKDKIADVAKDKIEKIKHRSQKIKEEEVEEEIEVFEPGTFGAYFDRVRTITPFLIADLIAKEGVHVENGMHTPYLDSRGVWTIGFGSTMLKDGTRVKSTTAPITTEEAYELARWHLEEGETYFGMYCYDVAFDEVNINDPSEAFAMGSVIYNSFSKLIEDPNSRNCNERFTRLRNLYKENGRGLTDEMVRDLFAQYPVTAPTSFGSAWLGGEKPQEVADKLGNFLAGGRGLVWRRWLEAGILTGDITPQMLLDCPMSGVYEFFELMGGKRASFFKQDANGNRRVIKETYATFRDWLQNPTDRHGIPITSRKKVRDYLPDYALEACDGKVCELGDKASKKQRIHQKIVERETYVLNYEEAYALAVDAYNAGNYEDAAAQFEQLAADNPDNALLHNDLAATYNHLGRYDDAIKHAQEVVRRIGDKSQYAAAQYNAGFAYEQKGDLEKALANYKLAVANGSRRVQSDVTRVKNKLNGRTETKSKRVAFNEGAGRIKAKSAKIFAISKTKTDESHT